MSNAGMPGPIPTGQSPHEIDELYKLNTNMTTLQEDANNNAATLKSSVDSINNSVTPLLQDIKNALVASGSTEEQIAEINTSIQNLTKQLQTLTETVNINTQNITSATNTAEAASTAAQSALTNSNDAQSQITEVKNTIGSVPSSEADLATWIQEVDKNATEGVTSASEAKQDAQGANNKVNTLDDTIGGDPATPFSNYYAWINKIYMSLVTMVQEFQSDDDITNLDDWGEVITSLINTRYNVAILNPYQARNIASRSQENINDIKNQRNGIYFTYNTTNMPISDSAGYIILKFEINTYLSSSSSTIGNMGILMVIPFTTPEIYLKYIKGSNLSSNWTKI